MVKMHSLVPGLWWGEGDHPCDALKELLFLRGAGCEDAERCTYWWWRVVIAKV